MKATGSSKDERLLPRFRTWPTGWIENSFTDKGVMKVNQIRRKSEAFTRGPLCARCVSHFYNHFTRLSPKPNNSIWVSGLVSGFCALQNPRSFHCPVPSCVHLLHLAAQAPRATPAEEASVPGAEVGCTSSMASAVTPSPGPRLLNDHLHL